MKQKNLEREKKNTRKRENTDKNHLKLISSKREKRAL